MSKKQKQLRAFELVQRTNCLTNQNFVLSENPEQKENKMRLCNLISEQDCQKFIDALVERGLLEKSSFMKHTGDKQRKTAMNANGSPVTDKNGKPATIIVDELEHIHLALLFKEVQTFQSVSELFFQITGKIVPPNCVAMCEYLHKNPNAEISDEQQYALMVTYQTHAGKKGATTPFIAQTLEKGQKEYSYKLYFNMHKMEHIDENRNTVTEMKEEMKFIADFEKEPLGAEIISEFTAKTSKVHQNLYNPDRLTTYNTDVIECFRMREEISKMESEKSEQRKLEKEAMQVLIDIREGKIPEYDYERLVSPAVDACMKNGQVANAYNYYYNKIKAELRAKGFKNAPAKNVYFIEGGAGTGKSSLAQELCEANHMSYYVTSTGAHAFDDYQGQEVIILDDCRDSSYRLNELLKMLDNNTRCDIQARYHNKNLCAVKLIIITSAKPLMQWYQEGYDRGEQLTQLYRRIKVHFTLEMLSDGTSICTQRIWNKNTKCYEVKNVEKYSSNFDDLFDEGEDAVHLGEISMNQMRAGMEHLGMKHSSLSASQTSPVAPPAPAPQTSPAVQPVQSSANAKPAFNGYILGGSKPVAPTTPSTNPWYPFNSPAKVETPADTSEHCYSMQRALLAPKHHDGFELLS